MTQRNEALAAAFEQASGGLATVVEDLSDAAWSTVPAGEARTAGQITYHMAKVYHNVGSFIQLAVDGQPLPELTMEILHGLNAEEAARYADASRADALKMLHQNSAAIASLLRTLSDAQLDTSTTFFGGSMTVETLAQNALVGHTHEHVASIQAAAASV